MVGVQHVLEGTDYILFMLALELATQTLHMLLIPIVAFTLAHTATLAAVAFGFSLPVPEQFIEAAIVGSIALLVIAHCAGAKAERIWWITAVISLVHELGFGQALTATLGDLQQWGEALISITVGVEATHLLIALIAIGGLSLIRKPESQEMVKQFAGVALVGISLYWTVERLIG